MSILRHLQPVFAGLVVTSTLAAQGTDWDRLVVQRWPGDSIRKVSEAAFESFLRQHLGGVAGDKQRAVRAFQTAQHRAYGLPTDAALTFLVPTPLRRPLPESVIDLVVPEGPEPNGAPTSGGSPTNLGCGNEGAGTILTVGDEDWWTFSVGADSIVTIATTGRGVSAIDDTILEVRHTSGTLIAANDDAAERGRLSRIDAAVGPGTYHVVVRGFGAHVGGYGVDLRCRTPGVGTFVVPEAAEPNDDPGTGGVPTALNCGQQGLGTIATATDSDWWRLVLAQPAVVTAETGDGIQPIGDTTLALRDTAGVQIAFDDDGGTGLYSSITRNLAAGTYYFDVRGFSPSTGGYVLDVLCHPALPAVAEGPEPNHGPASGGTPTLAPCGSDGQGVLTTSTDSDWWEFRLSRAGRVTGTTAPGTTGPVLIDTTLRLWDRNGALLEYDDDGGPGLHSAIVRTLPAGTYYFDVQGFPQTTGGYRLAIVCEGDYAAFDVYPGGCAGSNGVPTMVARAGEVPLTGTTFSVDVRGLVANAPGVGLLGFSRFLPGGVPLPLDLAVLGAPGCLLETDIALSVPLTADAAGMTTLTFWVPDRASLHDVRFLLQVAGVDLGVNQLNLTTSNWAEGTFNDR